MKPVDEIPDEELGAELDATIDARIENEHVVHLLKRIYADLDTAADTHTLRAERVGDLRAIEQAVSDIRHAVTDDVLELGKRENKIRDRLQG